jgi:methyltransferase family protein
MPALRNVEPEWLDTLPADDPKAIRARRDLRRVNAWMLHSGIMSAALLTHCAGVKPRTIVDLGGGDGAFTLSVARRLAPHWPDVTVILVDRHDIVSEQTRAAYRALQWRLEAVRMDVFDFLDSPTVAGADVMTANLFLHHFQADQLACLLALASRSVALLVACEPRRGALGLLGSRMLWTLGCNGVTRHDALLSVRAGFAGQELSNLWPTDCGWELREEGAWLFTHRFVARRMRNGR